MPIINMFRDAIWPGGQYKPSNTPRSPEEKTRTRDEANRKLSALVPGAYLRKQFSTQKLTKRLCLLADLAANMIGRSNARRGARRIFAVLQNRRLNQHIAYTVVDEVCLFIPLIIFSSSLSFLHQIFAALFPETVAAP